MRRVGLSVVLGVCAAAIGIAAQGQPPPQPPPAPGQLAPQYFNWRKISIYGGSNEIQKNIIAKAILGL